MLLLDTFGAQLQPFPAHPLLTRLPAHSFRIQAPAFLVSPHTRHSKRQVSQPRLSIRHAAYLSQRLRCPARANRGTRATDAQTYPREKTNTQTDTDVAHSTAGASSLKPARTEPKPGLANHLSPTRAPCLAAAFIRSRPAVPEPPSCKQHVIGIGDPDPLPGIPRRVLGRADVDAELV